MSKFIPAPDILNGTQKKRARKSFSDQKGDIFHELKKTIKDSYSNDAFAGVGNMQAIVLHKIDAGDPSKQAWKNPLTAYSYFVKNKVPDFIEIRYRVPELHAHLPEPKDANDFLAINLHPVAIIKKDKGIPEVGDIVTLDFADKVNFTGAMVVETFNSEKPPNPGGGICTPAGTFNSAVAPLNTTAPTGDSITPAADSSGTRNDPASEGFEQDIRYPNSQEIIDSWDPITGDIAKRSLKRAIYNVSIDDFNKMSDFTSEKGVVSKLAAKGVFSVCFTVSDRGRYLRDKPRLMRIMKTLRDNNMDVSILVREKNTNFNKAIIHAADIARNSHGIKNVFFEIYDRYTVDEMIRMDGAFRNLCNSISANYGVIIKENYIDSNLPSLQDFTFIADNRYDYSERNERVTETSTDTQVTARSALSAKFPDSFPMYYLGGINFIKTPGEPCVSGKRTNEILDGEIEEHAWGSEGASLYFFDLYEYLNEDMSKTLQRKVSGYSDGFAEPLKQSLLNSMFTDEAPKLSNVADIQARSSVNAKEEPSFNSDSDSNSQTAQQATPAPFNAAPGAQCPPFAGGAMPAGEFNGPPGPALQPESFRFDEIANYQDLGWTTSPGNTINNVIFEFMEKFAAAVYRRIPATDPIFTNSDPKKIRLTSTARTTSKQAWLMWDKMRQQGDYGVTSVYNENASWVRTVMRTYHEAGRPSDRSTFTLENPKFAEAVAAIDARVAAGGGSPHLQGRGVDVHTFSHLRAEGIEPHQSANKAQMNSSRYVQAIIAACAEVGGKPLVENYQQHVHIGIL